MNCFSCKSKLKWCKCHSHWFCPDRCSFVTEKEYSDDLNDYLLDPFA